MAYDDWKTASPEEYSDDSERGCCEICRQPVSVEELDRNGICADCGKQAVQCIGCGKFAPRHDVDDAGLCDACEPDDFLWLDAA